jgi:hypothetical protein
MQSLMDLEAMLELLMAEGMVRCERRGSVDSESVMEWRRRVLACERDIWRLRGGEWLDPVVPSVSFGPSAWSVLLFPGRLEVSGAQVAGEKSVARLVFRGCCFQSYEAVSVESIESHRLWGHGLDLFGVFVVRGAAAEHGKYNRYLVSTGESILEVLATTLDLEYPAHEPV